MSKFRAFMKNPFASLLIACVFTVSAGVATAEKADRSKPMNIESDALRYDDLKQVSVFSGRVVMTKGSIVVRANQIEVRQDPDGFQFGTITGSAEALAFFRQKRDGVDEFIEGSAESIEYDGKADTVRFIKKAQLRRLRGTTVADEISGSLIVYENTTDMFTVDGGSKSAAGTPSAPAGRVRAVLTPKQEPGAAAAPAMPPATLRQSTTLGGAVK
jgi:lipopolysaccharide export system protein LptA